MAGKAHRRGGHAIEAPKILGRIEVSGIDCVVIPEGAFAALTANIPVEEIRTALSAPTDPPRRTPSDAIPTHHLSEACRRRQILETVEQLSKRLGRTRALADVARQRRVGVTTMRGWMKRVAGRPRVEWEAFLVPAWKGAQSRSISGNVLTYFLTLRSRPERPSHRFCHAQTVKAAKANGWGRVPSLRTLYRRGLAARPLN